MVMEQEKVQPTPLSGVEAQEGILYKVAESLSKSCHLHPDNAYSTVRAKITIELTLSDFGRDVNDNHVIETSLDTGLPGEPEHVEHAEATIEAVPPNQFRVETDQPVPVVTIEDGKRVTKKVRYAARKVK